MEYRHQSDGALHTGALDHTVLGGFDYMRYARHLQQAPLLIDNLVTSTSTGFPLQPIWDVYAPQYGQIVCYLARRNWGAFSRQRRRLDDRGTEMQQSTGLYVQDQVKLGNWTAVLGLRQDWLAIEQDGEPTAATRRRPAAPRYSTTSTSV